MKLKRVIQAVFFILILSISVGHTLAESGINVPFLSTASLHAVCPVGGVVSVYEYFVTGTYVKKVHESSFVLMFVVFGMAIILGPVFCGWICPFGTFQEWIAKIGKKIFKKKYNTFIPYKVDKYLRFIRYIVLTLVLIKTAQSATLLFVNIDPYYALFNIWTDEVAITSYIALLLTIILSLFVERPFCKYFCPYGALLGITNLFKIATIKRKETTCISCNICDKKCPMNIPLSNIKVSRNHQCITCLECTSEVHCPKNDTLVLSIKDKIIKSKTVAIITVSLFIIGVGGSMVLNLWKTETSKDPVKYTSGEFIGENNPADIRGSYSLMDINNAFDVPVDIIVKGFSLNDIENPNEYKLKELEARYVLDGDMEIGTDSVRYFVALYKSLPYIPEEGTRLLRQANSVLKDIISEEDKTKLNLILVDIIESGSTSEIIEQVETVIELEIKGKTTFNDVIKMGLSEESIKEVLGSLPEDFNMTIRDFSSNNGLEFGEVRIELQDKI